MVEIPSLRARYDAVRAFTEALCSPLAPEDYVIQSMPDASPTKWHLAHTSWFFETFVLREAGVQHPGAPPDEPAAPPGPYDPFDPRYAFLFNSYYVSVGDRHSRPRRGLLSRPTVEETYRYRRHVDARMRDLLAEIEAGGHAALASTVEIGLHHEQQHQELLLTDIKHAFAQNPLRPAMWPPEPTLPPGDQTLRDLGDARFLHHPEGLQWIGHEGPSFAFDNESPRHRTFLHAFALASRPVTCGEYLAFIDDGGYARPELWLSGGWDAVVANGWRAPLYWEQDGGPFRLFTLRGLRDLDPAEPVCHVSYFEADAYARWSGARLPTEAEWETAAALAAADTDPEGPARPRDGAFADDARYHPAQLARDDGGAPQRLLGDVWEWTASPYVPYPGFTPWPGALGEYNGKFMSSQMVLRGGSCFTPRSHIRPTYRNFFPPDARWQMSGIRLARSA